VKGKPLSETHPDIAAEADGWDPSEITFGSSKIKKWICRKNPNHRWERMVAYRTNQGLGCPYCSGHKVLQGDNDLATTDPDIAAEADGWDPRTVTRGKSTKANWKCSKNEEHKWSAAIYLRTSGRGCPYCNGKGSSAKVKPGMNDLATTHPKIAAEADGWDPKTLRAGSNKIVAWVCTMNSQHKWSTTITSRQKTGCPYCANPRKKFLVGEGDLATTHPKIAAEADGWDPKTVMAGSNELRDWVCSLDSSHNWRASIQNRTKTTKPSNCPVCASQKLLLGFNDLATTHPEVAKEAFGWDPTTLMAGSNMKRLWRCMEDSTHTWTTTPASRTGVMKTGCPSCSKTGFDPNERGWIYFLEHQLWGMFQIGITNYPKKRLATHQKNGWEAIEVRGPMDGYLVQSWETAMLRMLKSHGADLSNQSIAGQFDGYSEAWSKSTFHAESIFTLMEQTRDFENNR
jgi:hypothetical protein